MKKELVQILNPMIDRYIKIDKGNGVIVSTKKSPGPYAGVKVVTKENGD